jgi:hypothetical protein
VLGFVLLLCLAPLATAQAADLLVPQQYPTVGAAVSAASDGDRIIVASGVYDEQQIPIHKHVEIVGAGTADTMIRRSASGDLFVVNGGAQLVLRRLQARGRTDAGRVLLVEGHSTVTLDEVLLDTGTRDYGALLRVRESSQVYAEQSIFRNGIATSRGGGILIEHDSHAFLEDTLLGDNRSDGWTADGGGVYVDATSSFELSSSTVHGNWATRGGGLFVGGVALIVNSTLAHNDASNGGGIAVAPGGTAEVIHATIYGNRADTGGAVSTGGSVVVDRSILYSPSPRWGASCAGLTTAVVTRSVLDESCLEGDPDTNVVAASDPIAGILSDHGGPTPTLMIVHGGPAHDLVACSQILSDQRGMSRPTGVQCDAGSVEARAPLGFDCGSPEECETFHCMDGVCCERSCEGQCEACDVEDHAGQCTPVIGSPHGGRASCASDGSACGGACDGVEREECAYPDASTSCAEASCAEGVATAPGQCDGAGSCVAGAIDGCSPYACGEDACLRSCEGDEDCSSGFVCTEGMCQEPPAPEPDASVPDGGPNDGGVWRADAGEAAPPDGGCGCLAAGQSSTPTHGFALLLALMALGSLSRSRGRRRTRRATRSE